MRKQNRPNQTARKQMHNLTVELFARDKNARRQLLDEALAVSPTTVTEPASPTSPTSPITSPSEPPPPERTPSEPTPAESPSTSPELIPELVQILLAPETSLPPVPLPPKQRHRKESIVSASSKSKSSNKAVDLKQRQKPVNPRTTKPFKKVSSAPSPAAPKTEKPAPPAQPVPVLEVPKEEPEETLTCAQIIEQEEAAENEARRVSEEAVQQTVAPVVIPEVVPEVIPKVVEKKDLKSEASPTATAPAVPEPSSPNNSPTTPVTPEPEDPEEFVTPPPLQRVPHSAQPAHLASIRAVTESMNIAAITSSEPMSFAACVRKQPLVESMSNSPSPYAKFDGKSNPFSSGGGGGGFGGGGSLGGFSRESNKNSNPFANRKRFNYEYESNGFSNSNRFASDRAEQLRDATEAGGFSAFSSSKSNGFTRNIPRESSSSGMLPSWYKGRSFSTASSHYPQSSASSGRFSSFASQSATMNIPSHGHVEDLDGFLTVGSQSSNYFNRRSDLNLKKERWARIKAKKRLLRRPVEDEFYEDPDEDEEILRGNGVMLNQIVQQSFSGNYEDADLLRKYQRDVAYVKERVLEAIDGNIDGIRDLRFLLASVQTYGNIDGECMMAELAMHEFSLFSGILEKFHAIVGPWQIENESQKRRANRHAFETHRIPLQNAMATISKKKLCEEILGRVEPSIAFHQGVKVGLYSESCDEKTRVELNIKNNFKDPGMLTDHHDRRFILVLQSELDLMVDSMKHLAKTVDLKYDGFPTNHSRFVIVEAFVEAISDIMGEKVDVETMRWFSLLGQKIDAVDSESPWETGTDFHCSRHSEPKSNFCAAVTVGRTCCIVYHVLGSFFRKYHLNKIPTALHDHNNPV